MAAKTKRAAKAKKKAKAFDGECWMLLCETPDGKVQPCMAAEHEDQARMTAKSLSGSFYTYRVARVRVTEAGKGAK